MVQEPFETTRWSRLQLVMVDAEDHGEIRALAGRRDEHALGAGFEMRLRLVLRREDAGAFERDVDAERLMGQLGRVPDRRDLDLAHADIDGVAGNLHFVREAAVDGIVTQEMRVGFNRAKVVERDHLDVLAAQLHDGAQDIAADAPKAVDGDLHGHGSYLSLAV